MRRIGLVAWIIGCALIALAAGFGSRTLREIGAVGTVQELRRAGDWIAVRTNQNVLAVLDSRSGELLWKNIVSEDEAVEKFAVGGGRLFALFSSEKASDVVRAFDLESSSLLWEVSLPTPVRSEGSKRDLLFQKQAQLLTVLSQGELFVFGEPAGIAAPAIWKNNLPDVSVSFSQLLPMSGHSGLAAVGCVVELGECVAMAQASLDTRSRQTRIEALPNSNLSAKGALITAATVDGTTQPCAWVVEKANDKVSVQFLATGKNGLHAQSIEAAGSDFSTQSVIFFREGKLRPALLLCTEKHHCGYIDTSVKNGEWHLSRDADWSLDSARLPVWSFAPEAGSLVADLKFLALTLTSLESGNGKKGDFSLAVGSRESLSSLLFSKFFLLDANQLVVGNYGGMVLVLRSASAGVCSISQDTEWARDESSTNIRQAFFLTTSPSLAQDGDEEHVSHPMAVFVSHNSVENGPLPWEQLELRVRGISLQDAHEDWLALPVAGDNVVVTALHASALHWQPHSAQNAEDANKNAVLLVASTNQGNFLWIIDSHEGAAFSSLDYKPSSHSRMSASRSFRPANIFVHEVRPTSHLRVSEPLQYISAAGLAPSFSLVYSVGDRLQEWRVHSISAQGPRFLHSVDRRSGALTVFSVSNATCESAAPDMQCYWAFPTARTELGGEILAAARMTEGDAINSPVSVLGDDNLLRKYLNPNLIVLCTSHNESALSLYAVDSVSGRIARKFNIENGAAPVRAVIMENIVVATYWNSKAKRSELFVSALYEGLIGRTELTPGLKSWPRMLGLDNSAAVDERTAFSQPQLLSVEKTYILPRLVTHVQHTVSAKGITNKNLLLSLDSGEVFSLDLRQVHPRRPLSEPTQAEKDEGLHRYNPFVALLPVQSLTKNSTLVGGGELQSIVAPQLLESSCLVAIFSTGGSRGVRILSHVPSQGFDTLAEDFNHALLLLLLSGLALAVLALRMMHSRNTLRRLWL